MSKKNLENYIIAKGKLTRYLNDNKMRKTSERFEILKCVVNMKEHFDVDTLFMIMKNNNFRVSKATLYNTMDILVDCGIIEKHQFLSDTALYEYINPQKKRHYHIVLSDSGDYIEFEDSRIDKIIKELELKYKLDVKKSQFVLYAIKK
ncbi:MAG: Fur family transcriptional regulator [Bacteroidales bacterium]